MQSLASCCSCWFSTARANAFKKDTEALVNDLRSTAAGVHAVLSTMAGQTDEILARAEKTLQAQEALREQQAAIRAATETANFHLGQLQGSIQAFGLRQETIGDQVLSSMGSLKEGTKKVGENVAESLLLQRQMEASQEAAAAALGRLHSAQAQLHAQQTRGHRRLERLAQEHHRRTLLWQGQVRQAQGRVLEAQGRVLEGQGRVEEEVRRTGEQHAAAFREQARAMDEVARRTLQYHTETVLWQWRMQGIQSQLLAGQSQVAGAVSAAALEAQRHREAEQEWNRQAEAYHREQAAEMVQMKRVTVSAVQRCALQYTIVPYSSLLCPTVLLYPTQ